MAYDGTRPRDDDFVKQSAELIRKNFEGLRTEGIVTPKPPLFGAGAPAVTLGEIFERYIDTATGNEYYKSTSGWARVSDLGGIYKTEAGVYYSAAAPAVSFGSIGDVCFCEGSLAQKMYIKEVTGWAQKLLLPKGSEKYQDMGSVSGTKNINAVNGTLVKMTISGTTTITLTAALESGHGCTLTLLMRKGGAYTVNWPASVAWAGGIAPTFSEIETDVIALTAINGSDWIGTVVGATAELESRIQEIETILAPLDPITLTYSQYITVPAHVHFARISGCAGGGSGGGVTANDTRYIGGTGGTGGGALDYFITVAPGRTYAVKIGAGGASTRGVGNPGGDTSFGDLLVLGGGSGGPQATIGNRAPGPGANGAGVTAGAIFGTVPTTPRITFPSEGVDGIGYGTGGSGAWGPAASGKGAPGFLTIQWEK